MGKKQKQYKKCGKEGFMMSNSIKQNKTKADAEPAKKDENLSMDELEQVSGGFSLRDVDTVNTTDIDDDTKSKI